MLTKIIEATNRDKNWGKFMIGWFTSEERHIRSSIDDNSVVNTRWSENHLLVTDLETGEAAIFKMGGFAKADLNKHAIWVCPLFEPFLEWLYQQNLSTFSNVENLPALVQLPEAEFQMRGYRRLPDLSSIQAEAHGLGQEDIAERAKEWAKKMREDKTPLEDILARLESGDWMQDSFTLEQASG